MTTPWTIAPIWQGETVAILAAGPAMTPELAATMRGCKTIAVNRAVQHAPWADLFIALDPHPPYWAAAEGFGGLRVCGVACDANDALYAGMFYETVQVGGSTLHIRNNALAALRIAARLGAAKIVLVGFAPELYDQLHAHTGFTGFAAGLEQITAELRATGIDVQRLGASADVCTPEPRHV